MLADTETRLELIYIRVDYRHRVRGPVGDIDVSVSGGEGKLFGFIPDTDSSYNLIARDY